MDRVAWGGLTDRVRPMLDPTEKRLPVDLSAEHDVPNQFVLVFRERADRRRPTWCCRLWLPIQERKNPRNPYVLISLDTTDLNVARQKAYQWRREYDARRSPHADVPSFKDVAEAWIAHVEAQRAAAAEYGEKVPGIDQYRKGKSVTNRYLIPYFGAYPVNAIPPAVCNAYGGWRQAYYVTGPGKTNNEITYERGGTTIKSRAKASANPGRSTVAKDVEAFNKIITYAQTNYTMLDWSIEPRMKRPTAGAREPSPRSRFSRSHVRLIFKRADEWITYRTDDEQKRFDRAVLFGLISFLWLTGARTSEALVLKVGDIITSVAEDEYSIPTRGVLGGEDEENDVDSNTFSAMDFGVSFPGIKRVSHERVAVPRTEFEAFYCSHGAVLKHRFRPEDQEPDLDGLPPDLPLFPNWDGGRAKDIGNRHASLLDFTTSKRFPSGLRVVDGKNMSLSCWRHTYASEMIEDFVKERKPNMVYWLARNMGTSEEMIEKYYGRLLPAFAKDELRR